MKKLFTLMLMAAMTMATWATDYDEEIVVTVNGTSSQQHGIISVVEDGDTYTLTLKNFVLQSEDGPMGVGNIELTGIVPQQSATATILKAQDNVVITEGNDPSVPFWMASMLPPVPVDLVAAINGDHLRASIHINMMETLEQIIEVTIGSGYQMRNQGFEEWHTSAENYEEPNGWHSFESATGSFVALTGHHMQKSADAHGGETSARIYASTVLFTIVANGTMTTGRMSANAMSATDPKNNAFLDTSLTDVDGNGDPFYMPLVARPDSLVLWMKFKQGTANASHPYATVSAAITDGTYYQDPEDKEYNNVIARAKNNVIAETNGEWKRISIPFEYTDAQLDPKAILVTISTNADAGQGSNNDEVLVDDIALVYNANVTAITVDGNAVEGFTPEQTTYEATTEKVLTADDIDATVEGRGAHVLKTVNKTDNGYECVVEALTADLTVLNRYVINVKDVSDGVRTVNNRKQATAIYYTVSGQQASVLLPGQTYICIAADGTVTKVRR